MSSATKTRAELQDELEALRKHEARYRALAERNPYGIQEIDASGTIVFANKAHHEMYGYREGELLGRNIVEFLSPGPQRDELPTYLALLKKNQPPPSLYQQKIRTKDGKERHIEVSWDYLLDETRGVRGFISVLTDVTERDRAESELTQYRQHLEELVEQRTRELDGSREALRRSEHLASLGAFAAGIAHEINNPLGLILLATNLARKSIDEPETTRELLRQTELNVQRCARIVHGVLRFAQEQSAEKWALDLNEVIRHTLDFTQQDAKRRGVAMEAHLAAALHPILANSIEIEQVGVNLINNALNACGEANCVTIETSEVDGKVRLVVRDDGCGMTKEQVRHAFAPFYTSRGREGGTGLGLSTVHGIVTDHGGTLAIASKEHEGTTFTIEFPLHNEPEAEWAEDTRR